jgi:hypothetical protein
MVCLLQLVFHSKAAWAWSALCRVGFPYAKPLGHGSEASARRVSMAQASKSYIRQLARLGSRSARASDIARGAALSVLPPARWFSSVEEHALGRHIQLTPEAACGALEKPAWKGLCETAFYHHKVAKRALTEGEIPTCARAAQEGATETAEGLARWGNAGRHETCKFSPPSLKIHPPTSKWLP